LALKGYLHRCRPCKGLSKRVEPSAYSEYTPFQGAPAKRRKQNCNIEGLAFAAATILESDENATTKWRRRSI
jgi:hypothetical protein